MEWDSRASSGFAYTGTFQTFGHLGWAPDGPVCCSYEVEVIAAEDGGVGDFLVRATCDTDGDGVPAIFTSSGKENAKQVTGDEVR